MEDSESTNQGKRYSVILILLGILIIALLGLMIVYQIFLSSKVHRSITVEAGTTDLSVDQFLKNKEDKASFVTNIATLNMNQIGKYKVQIEVGDKIYTSIMELVDTTAPKVEVKDVEVACGTEVRPEDFIVRVDDATGVKVTFQKEPDITKEGTSKVELIIKDSAGNETKEGASLLLGKIHDSIRVESGTKTIDINDCLMVQNDTAKFVTDISKLKFEQLGSQKIQIEVDGKKYDIDVLVVDTTPPKATVNAVSVCIGQVIEAKRFVKDIVDQTEVTVDYVMEPDFSKLGTTSFQVRLTDTSKNITTLDVKVVVTKDLDAPVIKGVQDQTVYMDGTVSYKKGITVTDNSGEEIPLQIDHSKVDMTKKGNYKVTYTAIDSAGNTTKETAIFTVAKKPKNYVEPEVVDKMADKILKTIIKKDMSKKKQAEAIYAYIKDNMSYTSTSDKTDWIQSAYQAMKQEKGDCFVYYAFAQELLTRAGIDNIKVVQKDGVEGSTHYWNMVNYGKGWYHFDTTPRKAGGEFCLVTDAYLEEYSKTHDNSHVWDRTVYPATPIK